MKFLPGLLIGIIVVAASAATIPPPVSNLPICPAAAHDRYIAIGPDGQRYPTWHPQIDADYGCRYDHEHGSNPALVLPGYRPLYGYTATHGGMPEGHAGFKSYAIRAAGLTWLITQHQGTANAAAAACIRYHTLDLFAVTSAGVRVVDLHLMADFGAARSNETNAILPTACAQPTSGTTGLRQFPIASGTNNGYEPWRADAPGNIIGLRLANLTPNTINPQTACDPIACTAALARVDPNIGPALGTWRSISVHPGFGITATGAYSGTFTTNAHATDAGDVVQYVAPGLDVRETGEVEWYPYDSQAYIYGPQTPVLNAIPFRANPLITGAD